MQEKISRLEKEQENQALKLQSLQKITESVMIQMPPLIEGIKDVSEKISECTAAMTKNTIMQENSSDDIKELKRADEKKEIRITTVEKTQAANQVVIDAVKGLGAKLIGFSFALIGAACAVIFAASKFLGQ